MRPFALAFFVSEQILANFDERMRNIAALAVDPTFEGVSGRYYEGAKEIRSSRDSYDAAKALELWETSERLVQHVTT